VFLTTFLIRKPIGREAAAHELNKPGYVDEKSTGNPVGAVRNAKWSCFKVGAPRQQLDGVSDFPMAYSGVRQLAAPWVSA
jgi:hypothetical protein